ncbi:MAG: hypothetical protein JWM68_160 [Verrucomicrobiales bacterium]|nr:hypothetical protein [Verrucomicrobiales bacterium]
MSTKSVFAAGLGLALFLVGCATPLPPGAERGPDGTMAYDILIEASPPGARIEANGSSHGNAPVHLKMYGDRDGTFHDFGSYNYVIRALPLTTNQFTQTRVFRTGHMLAGEDTIPSHIYFDMTQPQPTYVPVPVYPYPAYDYGPAPYYGPSMRFYFGGGGYRGGYYRHHGRW